ncbi:hypothetical protein GQ44DRAFT_774375 [Phaeosphaeriaceae sp. PMI808]|nr:hypothetical protein GQ44DRAFT_774375 [Phaeosphaeriaceae sp. PMI808]
MVKFFTFVATLAFALTALAAPNPNPNPNPDPIPNPFPEPAKCGSAIPGSDCGFNDQCKSCRCVKGICR